MLEELDIRGPRWSTTPVFEDGEALRQAIRDRRLEGVVAKRLRDPYRPGERGWVKRKNPANPRYDEEREAAYRFSRRMMGIALLVNGRGATVAIHKKDGTIGARNSYGSDPRRRRG